MDTLSSPIFLQIINALNIGVMVFDQQQQLKVWNHWLEKHAELPASLVQAILKVVFDNNDVLLDAHPAAAATIPANFTRNTFLPYHLGATRYYGARVTPGVMVSD